MTKEKEIEEKYGNLTLREVGISGIAYKMGQNSQKEKPSDSEIKEMIFDAKQEQKQKDLEMIDDFYNEFILNWNCKKDRVLIKQLYRGIKQKIKGDKE